MHPKIILRSVDSLRPADYNPRSISAEATAALDDSLRRFGIIKPLVVRHSDGLILAGHQRLASARRIGMTTVPVFEVDGVGECDEVRFNQLHNITEIGVASLAPMLTVDLPMDAQGFVTVPWQSVHLLDCGEEGGKIYANARLIQRFGQFANAVCNSLGEVIVSNVYAKTVRLMHLPLMVYVVRDEDVDDVQRTFARDYGEFCYDHIHRTSWMQSFAQKYRLRPSSEDKSVMTSFATSILYEQVVLPKISKQMHILDFGAGQKDYVGMLRANGYRIDGLEFYHRADTAYVIDTDEVDADVRRVCKHVSRCGGYDVVVCDSVLNSVDSSDAEHALLGTLSALCRPGGWIYFSGMPMQRAFQSNNQKVVRSCYSCIQFLDHDGFTANMRDGGWFFQHYHTMRTLTRAVRDTIGEPAAVFSCGKMHDGLSGELHGNSFQVAVRNQRILPLDELIRCLRFEFTLPLPSGRHYDYDRIIIPAFERLNK